MSKNNKDNKDFKAKGYNYYNHDEPMSEEAFKSVVTIQLQHLYKRMEDRLDAIDQAEEAGEADMEETISTLRMVDAIESEWITDDVVRAKLSLIGWSEELYAAAQGEQVASEADWEDFWAEYTEDDEDDEEGHF